MIRATSCPRSWARSPSFWCQNGLGPADIDSIGITNQRETTVVWDRETGQPVCNAIVWQCRRTADIVERADVGSRGGADASRSSTGLVPDAVLLGQQDQVDPGQRARRARATPRRGKLALRHRRHAGSSGTLTRRRASTPPTSPTPAAPCSSTSTSMRWDPWLLDLFGIPASMLPEVRPSSGDFGVTASPGRAGAASPSAALRATSRRRCSASAASRPGQAKNTYGTGCFLLHEHRQRGPCASTQRPASRPSPPPRPARRGRCTRSRAACSWRARSCNGCATSWGSSSSVAETRAAGAAQRPRHRRASTWCPRSRAWARRIGTRRHAARSYGLTRGANRAHIVRAALESLAYQVARPRGGHGGRRGVRRSASCNVDGGASANDFLMQFQCDILGCTLLRPACTRNHCVGRGVPGGSVDRVLEGRRRARLAARRRAAVHARHARRAARRPP